MVLILYDIIQNNLIKFQQKIHLLLHILLYQIVLLLQQLKKYMHLKLNKLLIKYKQNKY